MMRFRPLALVLAALFIIVLVVALLSSRAPASSKDDAVNFVLADLRSDPNFSSGDVMFAVYSASYSNDSGQWTVNVKITEVPHSQCPRTFVRTYNLMPVRRSLDEAVTANCNYGRPLAYPEEAIIASRLDSQVVRAINGGAQACAYSLPLSEADVQQYCPNSSYASLAAQTSGFNARWLVQWHSPSGDLLLGLDANGDIVNRATD